MLARIHPASGPLSGTVDPPSSKNYTTRTILVSCLASGESIVRKPAVQDDAIAMVACCRAMGAIITARDGGGAEVPFDIAYAARIDHLRLRGFGSAPRGGIVDPENAGTVLRLLLGIGALVDGDIRFDTAHYKESLGKRPNADLLDALRALGVAIDARGDSGMLPIALRGGRERIAAHLASRRAELGLAPDDFVPVPVSGTVSSQFVSSLLFLAPLLDQNIRIEVIKDLKSRPLIRTTCQVLAEAGITVRILNDDDNALPAFEIPAGQHYAAREWTVNGDWPGSAAILGAAAAVPGSHIRVRRLMDDEQGERRSADFYRALGCTVPRVDDQGTLELIAPELLHAAQVDGDQCTDAVLAMMGVASVADGTSIFDGIANLQFKECDRVREPITELRAIAGTPSVARWEPLDDPARILVQGNPNGYEGGITVDGRGDHRVIMLLSIVGLRCRNGLTISGVEHVAKSFPGWFDTLRAMGARVELLDDSGA